jgi:general L-amino acid transport system permease protein
VGVAFAPEPPGNITRWLRRNLFRTPLDGAVTVVGGLIAAYVAFRLIRFVLVTGRWEVVTENLKLFMVGRYPTIHLPRVAISVVVAAFVAALVAGMIHRRQVVAGTAVRLPPAARVRDLLGRFWPVLLGAALILPMTSTMGPWLMVAGAVAAAVAGRAIGDRLPRRWHAAVVVLAVATPFGLVLYLADGLGWAGWGGMMLNIYLAVVSILLCFPLGVLMALGRRSQLPLIRWLCTGLIELVRGAPLFVLLLMANVALGFFVPQAWAPSDVVRAIVVFTIFTAAYLAEIVRGGLQSLPRGQEEAGRALGLSPAKVTFLIVLPQALRNVIPAQVGQFISLFKDTTLAGAAMGLFEVLRVAQAVTTQGEFRGQLLLPETFGFVALLFWIGSYTMSRESQRIEHKLGVGER